MAWLESFATEAIWDGVKAGVQKFRGRGIRITSPRPGEILSGAEQLNANNIAFPIRGILKHLPAGHEIWVLTQDDSTGKVWPQGFFPVQSDAGSGEWMGKINGSGKST
jgi:hypothetical protein